MKKAIIVTADGPEHRFVTKELITALGENLIGIVIEEGKKRDGSITESLRAAFKRYGLLTTTERLLTKLYRKFIRADKRQLEASHRILGHLSPASFLPVGIPILRTQSANDSHCIDRVKELNPDIIFVYGTGIIRDKLLSVPSVGALNLHTGISPFYRGSDCAFWPLYNNEPLLLGSTVHKCSQELDGGDIYDRVSIRLAREDNPNTAFAKAVKAGASLYSSVANEMIQGNEVNSEKQDFSQGREYRFKDKTFMQELIMEIRVSSGRVRKMADENEGAPLPFRELN